MLFYQQVHLWHLVVTPLRRYIIVVWSGLKHCYNAAGKLGISAINTHVVRGVYSRGIADWTLLRFGWPFEILFSKMLSIELRWCIVEKFDKWPKEQGPTFPGMTTNTSSCVHLDEEFWRRYFNYVHCLKQFVDFRNLLFTYRVIQGSTPNWMHLRWCLTWKGLRTSTSYTNTYFIIIPTNGVITWLGCATKELP